MANGRIFTRLAVLALAAAVAGCTFGSGVRDSADRGGANVLGLNQPKQIERPDNITVQELRAYCPKVVLRSGTSTYDTYARGGEGDRDKIVFQSSISDVTRACKYDGGLLTMDVAAAIKIVPGPEATSTSTTLPIRVVVVRGDEVLYSKLHKFQPTINGLVGATQAVFSDPGVQVPSPSEPNLQIFIGFDTGPDRKS